MAPGNEHILAVLVILGVCALAIYRVVLWIMDAPCSQDPWDHEVEEAISRDEAVPLCHHCLTPQEHLGWFCPECGATVGPYCNYMPYVYVFSQGEIFRAGVTERLRARPLVVVGYVLVSLGMYVIFAPIYWFFLFKNLRRNDATAPDASPAV